MEDPSFSTLVMKRLILVRHGKSSWKYDLPDHERPLKKRGYKDADVVLRTFKQFFTPPAVLWSSPAERAHETALKFKEGLDIDDKEFKVVKSLYTFEGGDLLNVIKSCEDRVKQLMVFGHNPAMTNLVNQLGSENIDNLPTTGLCVIDFEIEHWKDLKNGKTILTLFPKNLR